MYSGFGFWEEAISGENREGNPNDGEADQAIASERFVEDEDADKELEGRGEVLQEAEGGEWNSFRGSGEE